MLARLQVIPGRTWQSLKDRYLKRILPVEEALGNLSAATSTTSSSSTSSSSTLAASKASPPRYPFLCFFSPFTLCQADRRTTCRGVVAGGVLRFARPSTSGSRRVSVAHDSSTPVRKQLFGKANTLDVSEDDEEGEEKEAEEDGDEDKEGENAGEEVPDGLKKSPKQQQPSPKRGTVTGTPTPTPTTTTTTKRKASETPPSAVAKEKIASPVAPKGKRRKIQDDSQEGEEEGANGKAPDSDAEEVEAGVVLKPSGQERTDRKRPGGRVQEVEHVVAR